MRRRRRDPRGNVGQVAAVAEIRTLHRLPRRPIVVGAGVRSVFEWNRLPADGPHVAAGRGMHTGELGVHGRCSNSNTRPAATARHRWCGDQRRGRGAVHATAHHLVTHGR
jgi:hypothetical protein